MVGLLSLAGHFFIVELRFLRFPGFPKKKKLKKKFSGKILEI